MLELIKLPVIIAADGGRCGGGGSGGGGVGVGVDYACHCSGNDYVGISYLYKDTM